MTITLKLCRRKPRLILGMTPEQWKARCQQIGIPYAEPNGPKLVGKEA